MDAQVVVVGAGPVGLMLAGELRLGGAEVVVVERRREACGESRASTVHARTMEILHSRRLTDALGSPAHDTHGHFAGIPLDLTLPCAFSGVWKVPQQRLEQVLAEWAGGLGAEIRRGWELTDVRQDPEGVRATVTGPRGPADLRCSYLVACDGEDSTVRRLTRADFPGRPPTRWLLRADITGVSPRPRRFERLPRGFAVAASGTGGVTRLIVHSHAGQRRPPSSAPDLRSLLEVWRDVTGEDLSGAEPLWINSLHDGSRQLAAYRLGRVLFAGDAAHQQLPVGGQALNLGLQDAVNLGWKLARQATGRASPGLLDSYHTERHRAGAEVLDNVRQQSRLLLGGAETEPLRRLAGERLAREPVRSRVAGIISGLGIRYGRGDGDALTGARLPAEDLHDDSAEALEAAGRAGRGVLIHLDARPVPVRTADLLTTPGRGRAGGRIPPSGFVLVRPDGHVAWAGEDPAALTRAVRQWFAPHGNDPADGSVPAPTPSASPSPSPTGMTR
ncbi:FAD-dependent monooxygenase [Streptomyces sp. NPDC035033]|uniref:FAD-dependent monooxygenase n=1 Tax=Streptomyces sp. NPDC035033 TaxID=3155368 RepID=UPI0033FECE5C